MSHFCCHHHHTPKQLINTLRSSGRIFAPTPYDCPQTLHREGHETLPTFLAEKEKLVSSTLPSRRNCLVLEEYLKEAWGRWLGRRWRHTQEERRRSLALVVPEAWEVAWGRGNPRERILNGIFGDYGLLNGMLLCTARSRASSQAPSIAKKS